MRLNWRFAARLVAVASLGVAALAQEDAQQEQDAYDPNRGVARISVMNGDVSVRRGDSGDYVAAALNAPLVVGDRVLTGPNSRAEVQFDYANMIRIGPDSEIRLSELASRRYQVQLARGLATFRVLRSSSADVEVSTPQVSIRPKKKGVYRLTVREDEQSDITVRSGEVEVFTPRGVETLHSGRTMQVRGTASDPEFQIAAAYGEDDWDRWNRDRDRDLERSASYRHVSPDIYGAEDLDSYGQWVPDSTYGTVWAPRVAAGWAPYRSGHWVWIDYYGWTWVSYDPWGWAPYHYGRWYVSPTYGWCWYPGGLGFGGRHYWSPGLVAFVGFGHGVGFGFGDVGWVPLAPFERYHPWYGRGYYGRGFNNVTVVNNVNIYNTYRNARISNAVTAVDGSGFGRGAAGRAWTGDVRQASLVRGQLPVTPSAESRRLSDRAFVQTPVSRTPENQRFFSSRQPAPVERIPFEQQRRSFEQSGSSAGNAPRVSGPGFGRGGSDAAVNRSEQPQNSGLRTRPEPPAQGGWRRFGEPTGTTGRVAPQVSDHSASGSQGIRTNPAPSNSGWGRFGEPSSRSAPADSTRPAPSSNNNGWNRFEGRPSANPDTSRGPGVFGGRGPQSSMPVERGAEPQTRFERPSHVDSAPQPVRISPPMVRERSMAPAPHYESARPSGGGGGSRGGDGGGGMSHGGGISRGGDGGGASHGGGGSRGGDGGGGGSRGGRNR